MKDLPEHAKGTKSTDQNDKVETKSISRKHVIERSRSGIVILLSIYLYRIGLISLMGGKWTSYRRMSEETVDEAIKLLQGKNSKNNRLTYYR